MERNHSDIDPTTIELEERYGRLVLPELPPAALGIEPKTPHTTREGFTVYGTNETSALRRLRAIEGVSVSELEQRMRAGNSSIAGFLGSRESLPRVLADDNETVRELGVTHQQLADFLQYAMFAEYQMSQRTEERGSQAFVHNGRTFAVRRESWRGYQESPFGDGDLTSSDYQVICLDDGSEMRFSGLLPSMIGRYGFYEGKGTSYRLEPQSVAVVAGFVGRYREDDPIVQLVRDPSAAVTIAGDDQLARLGSLRQAGMDLLTAPNYTLLCGDLGMLLTVTRMSLRGYGYDVTETDTRLIDRLRVRQAVGFDCTVDEHDLTLIAEAIPQQLPQLREAVLELVDKLLLAEGRFGNYGTDRAIKSLVNACTKGLEAGSAGEYAQAILQRFDLEDGRTASLVYGALAKLYESGDEIKGDTLAQLIGRVMPDFRQQLAAYMQGIGIDLPEDMPLTELLRQKGSIEAYDKALTETIEFAHRVGKVEDTISKHAMGVLFRVMGQAVDDPEYAIQANDMAIMQSIGADPELVPYAIKAMDGDASRNLASTIKQLYNGSAAQTRERADVISRLTGVADEAGMAFVDQLLRNRGLDGESSRYTLMGDAIALVAERTRQGDGRLLTQDDLTRMYAAIVQPAFGDLFASNLLDVRPGGLLRPVEVSLNPEVLAGLETIELPGFIPGLSSPRIAHVVTIAGKRYVIDEYHITDPDGNRLERGHDGKTVSLRSVPR